jgi:hypothetical protein
MNTHVYCKKPRHDDSHYTDRETTVLMATSMIPAIPQQIFYQSRLNTSRFQHTPYGHGLRTQERVHIAWFEDARSTRDVSDRQTSRVPSIVTIAV